MSPEIRQGAPEAPPRTRNKVVRMNYMRRNQKYVPATKKELSDAYDLIYTGATERTGTGTRLVEIRASQLEKLSRRGDPNAEFKADKALKTVVERYRAYHDGALNVLSKLEGLNIEVAETVALPGIGTDRPLSELATRDNLSVRFLLRYVDLQAMSEDETGKAPVEFMALDKDYIKTPVGSPMRARIDAFLEETTLGQAWELLGGAMEDQSSRAEFWVARLIEANPR